MIRISDIKLNISHSPGDLEDKILKKLHIGKKELKKIRIVKRSIDARKRDSVKFVYTVDVLLDNEDILLKREAEPGISAAPVDEMYKYPVQGDQQIPSRPVIIGSGPCGLFAAYFLAKEGYKPLIIERGSRAEERIKAVECFWETGRIDPAANIQFGEGGAGTFSDGKLNTGNRDPKGRKQLVLSTFIENGAPEEISYINKPHLGTDQLVKIVSNMRDRIIGLGGEFRFNTCFTGFIIKDNRVCGIITDKQEQIKTDIVILAIGHSARDTFKYLIESSPLTVVSKPFAIGVRAEHLQSDIDRAQYGDIPAGLLPPAEYKLTYHTKRGNGVYSFCMCPGGYVVNSSSQNGFMCINGMSYSGRDSENANSAIVAQVSPSDDPSENIRYQMDIEKKAWEQGGGRIISQRFGDLEQDRISTDYGRIHPQHKGQTVFGNVRDIIPHDVCNDIIEAMHAFGKKIKGFDDPDVIISAVETRTSSPVRILRNDDMESEISGIFPAGEGAGYAGGITSAAIDGIRVFEQIYSRYCAFSD